MTHDGRTTRAELRRAEMRERIIASATQVIAKRGYTATSIADVIAHAGIARGTFYLYFEGRDALFVEILDRFIARLQAAIEVIRPDDGAPTESLLIIIRRVIGILADSPDLSKVLFREAIGLSAEVDERVNTFYAYVHRMVKAALLRGHERGIIRAVDADLIATAIMGGLKEVLYARLVVGSDGAEPTAIAAAVFDFGFRGLSV